MMELSISKMFYREENQEENQKEKQKTQLLIMSITILSG